ncbi:hypothetical protein [Azospirillum argentinense]|uniref:Uncharacterized protein n=1 Tax=Azospirillum argentinense TaxID=2970906 RepID=A0A5B0KIW3_9PROT|nr:hypothetical protein [Azospirillum argentinense]KAA1052522.1 hypothetical protein FH063_004199 [Azospirillum argentinense]
MVTVWGISDSMLDGRYLRIFDFYSFRPLQGESSLKFHRRGAGSPALILSRKGALSAYFTRRIMEMRHPLLFSVDAARRRSGWQLGRPFSR